MSVQYNGQPVETLKWNGKTVLQFTSLIKVDLKDVKVSEYENTMTITASPVQGKMGTVTLKIKRHWGETGVSENFETKNITLTEGSKVYIKKQVLGSGKYSQFDNETVEEISTSYGVAARLKFTYSYAGENWTLMLPSSK